MLSMSTRQECHGNSSVTEPGLYYAYDIMYYILARWRILTYEYSINFIMFVGITLYCIFV